MEEKSLKGYKTVGERENILRNERGGKIVSRFVKGSPEVTRLQGL